MCSCPFFQWAWALFLSFTNYSGFNLDTAKWVGLSNYQKVFNDSEAMHSLLRTLELSLIIIPLTMILAFILAMMLIQNVKFQGGFRTIYYLPSVVPFVAAGLMWKILFSRDRGMLNTVLGMFGVEPVFWLGPEDVLLLPYHHVPVGGGRRHPHQHRGPQEHTERAV